MRSSGIVILDASCLKYLERAEAFELVATSLRAADLELFATPDNVIEVVSTANATVRGRLLSVLRRMTQTNPLLPSAHDLLAQTALQGLSGIHDFELEASPLTRLLDEDEPLPLDFVATANHYSEQSDALWADCHREVRPAIQKWLRDNDLQSAWPTLPTFLDDQWLRSSQLELYIAGLWESPRLPGTAQIEFVLGLPAWRLYLDAFGALIWGGSYAVKQSRTVQFSDLLQLVYLCVRDRSVLVTEDRAFLEVASAILTARHPLTRAMHWQDFINLTF